jgi:hypothetical protein
MSAENGMLATLSRFVSIAVLSCLVITGGLWFYQNRAEIVGGDETFSKNGNWFTRWAGIDHTKLKQHPTGFDFSEQASPFKTEFEFDPDWLKNMHGTVEFDWDR